MSRSSALAPRRAATAALIVTAIFTSFVASGFPSPRLGAGSRTFERVTQSDEPSDLATSATDPRPPVFSYFIGAEPARWHSVVPDTATQEREAPEIAYAFSFGGRGFGDRPTAVAVDASGAAYVVGTTDSTDFPAGPSRPDRPVTGTDVFIAKVAPDGSRLIYATYVGGRGSRATRFSIAEDALAVAVDASGNAYVAGYTYSTDFPTVNAHQPQASNTTSGAFDAFILKLDPSGTRLLYSTYLGGPDGSTRAGAAAISPSGHFFVGGTTTARQFPTSADLSALGTAGKAFVARFDPAGRIVNTVRFGGSQDDEVTGIAVDGGGAVTVAGIVRSRDFPTVRAAQPTCPTATEFGCNAAFVARFAPGERAFVYSTFLGGRRGEGASGVVLDPDGGAVVAGLTGSSDFPVRGGMQQTFSGGFLDAFVARFNPAGVLIASTYVGGGGTEDQLRVAAAPDGSIVIAGLTSSADLPVRDPVVVSHPHGPLFHSDDGADSWRSSSRGLAGTVNDLAADPDNPAVVWAATDDGLFRSEDGGSTWTPRNGGFPPALQGFVRLASVAVGPQGLMFAAGGSRGVFRSLDGGTTWALMEAWASGISHEIIIIDPRNPDTVYAGGSGVRKSVDGGLTWRDSSAGFPRGPTGNYYSADALAIDPHRPDTLYAGISGAIMKSTDAGATWVALALGVDIPLVFSLAIDPVSPDVVYAGTFRTILKTTDGGRTWHAVGPPSTFAAALAIDPRDRSTVYAAVPSSGDAKLLVSRNGGATWSRSDEGMEAASPHALLVTNGRLLAGGSVSAVPFAVRLRPDLADADFWTYLPGGFRRPIGLAVDLAGDIYVARQDDSTSNVDVLVTKISLPSPPSLR